MIASLLVQTKNMVTQTKTILGNILFQSEAKCLLCGQKGFPVCPDCEKDYYLASGHRCITCGKISTQVKCADCSAGKGPSNLTQVISLGYYSGAWKEFIHKVKYMSQPYLLQELQAILISCIIKHLPPPDLIVPVPMHVSRLAMRGYNQAEVLASVISRGLGIKQDSILHRTRNTIPQSSLGREDRLDNIHSAFYLQSAYHIKNFEIWLADDIITTGATMDECARVLKAHGGGNIYGICLGAGKDDNVSGAGHES